MTATAPVLRSALAADAPSLAKFAERTFRETFGRFNTPENMAAYLREHFSPQLQERELADPATRVRLALLPNAAGEEKLAGYAHLTKMTSGGVELKRLYVDAQHHGQGLAATLLADAKSVARELGAGELRLAVWEDNARAIAFYRKHGFVHTGAIDFMLGDDRQRDLVMTLTL